MIFRSTSAGFIGMFALPKTEKEGIPMKNGRREIALVVSGIILGASIAAPAAGAVLTAQQSSQKIVVDGRPVQIEAYSINGSNFVRLRLPPARPGLRRASRRRGYTQFDSSW